MCAVRLSCNFALGDIVEFKDMYVVEFKDMYVRYKKWEFSEETYVERINSIYFNVECDDYPVELWGQPVELWGQMYSEMPGRMYFTPERVVRVIEKSKNANAFFDGEPPIPLGQTVAYEEEVNKKMKRILDEIAGYQVRFDEDGLSWQYKLRDSGYVMGDDEFEVVRMEK